MSTRALRSIAWASATAAVTLGAALAVPQTADAREVKAQARGNVNASANRGNVNRSNVNRDVSRTNVNRTNVNVNRNTNVNVDRDIDIDVDVDHDWDHDWDHPIATGVAIGTAAAVTSAVVGSIVRSVPPGCQTIVVNGIGYSQCGTVWYQPQYVGTTVQYVVVNSPR
jgi:hypothetical protein